MQLNELNTQREVTLDFDVTYHSVSFIIQQNGFAFQWCSLVVFSGWLNRVSRRGFGLVGTKLNYWITELKVFKSNKQLSFVSQ